MVPWPLRPFRPLWESRRRRHLAIGISGLLLAAAGLLGYAVVYPEIPFAEAPTSLISSLRAEDTAKIFGKIVCNCGKAVDRSEAPAGFTGRAWNASYSSFSLRDVSGTIFVDTSSITRLTPGPHDGDYLEGDNASLYGTVYDQGGGVLAFRAQMMAKGPNDTAAASAFWIELAAAVGALMLVAAVTDRFLFGEAH